jgi:hypothetical protein
MFNKSLHKDADMPPDGVEEVFAVMRESKKREFTKNFVEEGTITDSVLMT